MRLSTAWALLILATGAKQPLQAKLIEVDNARESVDADGHVLGILDSETLTSQMDRGLEKLGAKFSGFADLLSIVKGAVLKKADSEITYDAGAGDRSGGRAARLQRSAHVDAAAGRRAARDGFPEAVQHLRPAPPPAHFQTPGEI